MYFMLPERRFRSAQIGGDTQFRRLGPCKMQPEKRTLAGRARRCAEAPEGTHTYPGRIVYMKMRPAGGLPRLGGP